MKRRKSRELTEREKVFIIKNYKTMSREELAEELEIPIQFLNNVMRELELTIRKWSEEEENYLRENYKIKSCEELSLELKRSAKAVKERITKLGLSKTGTTFKTWTTGKDTYLIENYGKESLETLARKLDRTLGAVKRRCLTLGIIVSKKKRKLWTEEQCKYLIENYGKESLETLVRKLDRTSPSVSGRISKLELVKYSNLLDSDKNALRSSARYISAEKLSLQFGLKPENIKLYAEYLETKEREESKKEEIVVTVTEKKCSKCGEIKKAEEFSKNRNKMGGLNPWCKSCHVKLDRERRRKKLEKQGWY